MDPCLFTRESPTFGRVYIALYLDDNLLVGHPQAINEVIEKLRDEGFVLKVKDNLKDYLSCEIDFSEDKKSAWLGQPNLIKIWRIPLENCQRFERIQNSRNSKQDSSQRAESVIARSVF